MTEKELNLESYKFVDKIKILEKNEPEKRRTEIDLKGSVSHLQFTDLSEYLSDSPAFRKSFMSDKWDTKIEVLIKNNWYGFYENSIYIDFYKFVNKLQKFNSLDKKLSIDYLNEKILLWLINVFINKKSESDLIHYLNEHIFIDVKEITFYYPILNLQIENPFKIGDVNVTYFEKKYFDNLLVKIHGENPTEKKIKIFDKTYRKYQGRVFIAVTTIAEKKKGEEISYNKACLVTDIIKLLSPTIGFPDWNCSTDLDKRVPFESEMLTIDKDNKYGFSISKSANNNHFNISNQILKDFEPLLSLLSQILLYDEKNEFEKTILESIKFFSKSLSEKDLHLRISQLIMVIESIFLLVAENYKMEKKCKRRMCDLLYKNDGFNKQKLFNILSNMYDIRHKMTHKSIRNYIELKELREFQMNIIDSLTRLIQLNHKIDSKKTLIEQLDKSYT